MRSCSRSEYDKFRFKLKRLILFTILKGHLLKTVRKDNQIEGSFKQLAGKIFIFRVFFIICSVNCTKSGALIWKISK